MSIIRIVTWSNCYQVESDKIMTLCIWNVTGRILESCTVQAVSWMSKEPGFSYSKASIWILETMLSPIQWVPGPISQAVEHPGHETNHLLYLHLPIYFHGLCRDGYAYMYWTCRTSGYRNVAKNIWCQKRICCKAEWIENYTGVLCIVPPSHSPTNLY
jgi:hypothetical protein